MKNTAVYYAIIVCVNLLPGIPISIKGISGLAFIMLSSAKFGRKSGFQTAAILMMVNFSYFFAGINIDLGMSSMVMGSSLFLLTAWYLGGLTDEMKAKNGYLLEQIEKRKNIETELNQKIVILQNLMSNLPTPVAFRDMDGRYIGCNHAFTECFGLAEKDLIGKTAYDLFEFSLAERCERLDTELIMRQVKQIHEDIVVFADGSIRTVICTKTLLKNEQGIPSGIVDMVIDITDQKERDQLKRSILEEQLVIDQLQKYDKLKTEFFSNISHELRTPLNVIFSAVQLLEIHALEVQSVNFRSKVKKNILSIRQNSLRLLRLVNNLIDITKIDARGFELHLENWNIVYLIEEITMSVADYVANQGIKLEFDTDMEEIMMACDEEKIERIMLNLLSNAIKFTPEGGSIYVSVCKKDSIVCIQVKDTGIGIPEERQSELFQRFCQIHPMSTRLHEGSGIGLNLVKSLVEMQGGKISVESQTGEGTAFQISLPCRLLQEEVLQKEQVYDRQLRIEKIQLEFSDIYSVKARA